MMVSSLRSFWSMVLLILGTILQHNFINAFLPSPDSISGIPSSRIIPPSIATHVHGGVLLRMSDRDDDTYDSKSRLRDLGFSDGEIERSTRKPVKEKRKVRVDMMSNVDATTLTAVGFALIAFNFFVLANSGDMGIGGIVATVINSF